MVTPQSSGILTVHDASIRAWVVREAWVTGRGKLGLATKGFKQRKDHHIIVLKSSIERGETNDTLLLRFCVVEMSEYHVPN